MTTGIIEFRGWQALSLENEYTQMVVLPDIGGKIASVRSKVTGTEFLWQDPNRPYTPRRYEGEFGDYDASGYDECFPSIGACPYPGGPWDQIPIPDHGELWTIPWRYELIDDHTVYTHAYGVRFPYHFERWFTLEDGATEYSLHYKITNLSPFDFKAMWSAHPLFTAQEGMRVLMPGSPTMRLTHASGDRIDVQLFKDYTWPWLDGAQGAPLDYSLIGSANLNANDKIYANTPAEGWCALFVPQKEEFVAFTLSAAEIPFIGVCINHGSYPPTGVKTFWVAIEPCTGWPDRLDETASSTPLTIAPWGDTSWTLGLRLGQAATADEAARVMGDTRN